MADGRYPPPDGDVEVVPQPPGPVAAVVAFTAHHVVAADVDPAWVRAQLPAGDFGAPTSARFLAALGDVLGRQPGSLDVVLCGRGVPGPPPVTLERVDDQVAHPRRERAHRYRRDVAVYQTTGRDGILIVGRGLAGRWEAAFEVEPGGRGRGLGRALARSATHLVPAGAPLFVQVAPGNAASLRAVLASGDFTAVGGEILFSG